MWVSVCKGFGWFALIHLITSENRQLFTVGEHTKQEAPSFLSYSVSLGVTAQYEVFCLAWLGFNKS